MAAEGRANESNGGEVEVGKPEAHEMRSEKACTR